MQKAYLDYCNVIDLLPKNLEARLFRAYIYMQRREYKEARVDYNVVLEQDVKTRQHVSGLSCWMRRKDGISRRWTL